MELLWSWRSISDLVEEADALVSDASSSTWKRLLSTLINWTDYAKSSSLTRLHRASFELQWAADPGASCAGSLQ